MKRYLVFFISIISLESSFGQENKKAQTIIHFNTGLVLSNFFNSEAPHKINIYGSDKLPGVVGADVTQSAGYFDYQTSIVKDVKMRVAIRLGIEHFIKNSWSLIGGIGYEEKGIDLKSFRRQSRFISYPDTPPNNLGGFPPSGTRYYDEIFEVDINNDYVTIPLLARGYFVDHKFYIQGGLYGGWLVRSEIETFNRKHTYLEGASYYEGESQFSFSMTDHKKEFTTNFDFGLSFGTGYCSEVADRLMLNLDLIFSAGIINVDGKYNNEYEERSIPGSTGYAVLIRSTNYFGLNSDATNISAQISFGLSYRL